MIHLFIKNAWWLKGSFILAASAVIAKGLSLYRDKLLIKLVGQNETLDVIYAAFKLVDLFYFLLLAGTAAVVLIPRLNESKNPNKTFSQAFAWIFWGFGSFLVLMFLLLPYLAPNFISGSTQEAKLLLQQLSGWMLGASFIMGISSLWMAINQWKERFLILGFAPIAYVAGMTLFIISFYETLGPLSVPIGTILAAGIHLLSNLFAGFKQFKTLHFYGPHQLTWSNKAASDVGLRISSNAAFVVNQAVDVWLASFLIVSSVAAFSLGTLMGHFLLTILGISVANALFPRLTKNQSGSKWLLAKGLGLISLLSIPGAALFYYLKPLILTQFFGLNDYMLWATDIVLGWTLISLPFACLIPLLSRYFLAKKNVWLPLTLTSTSLLIATLNAAYLALFYFPPETGIKGLAIGNFIANTLGFILFFGAFLGVKKSKS